MKTKQLNFRVSPEEKKMIQDAAERMGISLSAFLKLSAKKQANSMIRQFKVAESPEQYKV